MKSYKHLISTMAFALAGSLMSQHALAGSTFCSDGTYNGTLSEQDVWFTVLNGVTLADKRYADDCYGVLQGTGAGGGNVELSQVNALLPTWDNPDIPGDQLFQDLVKYDDKGNADQELLEGLSFSLSAVDLDEKQGTFKLTVTDTLATPPNLPTAIDLVISLKGSAASALYYFDGLLLGMNNEGEFIMKIPNANQNDFVELSNIALFGRLADDGGGGGGAAPEPGILFLMGAGLLGLGMARRRKSA